LAAVILAGDHRIVPYRVEHGWPLHFLTRQQWGYEDLSFRSIELPGLNRWRLTDRVHAFDGVNLAIDVSLAVFSLAGLALLLEWRRRAGSFWQISLRQMAVLTLAVAGFCAWWGSLHRQARREAASLSALDDLLAHAIVGDGISNTLTQSQYEVQWQSQGDWFLELVWDEKTKPRWFAEVVALKLTVEQDTADEALALVGRLSSLEELSVEVYGGSRRLSDESVRTIAGLRRLRELTINRLGGNWDMSVVGLNDEQIAHLARLADLRRLDVSKNHITDVGLDQLHGLKRLELLEISNNQTTDEGVDRLQQAIPGIMVLDD